MTAQPRRDVSLRLITGDARRLPHSPDSDLTGLVQAAVGGDERAVAGLVVRFDRGLRLTARSYGLSGWDVDDVVQHTWTQFLEHGSGMRNPGAIGKWLVTTARRHALRVLQRHVRERLTADPESEIAHDHTDELDVELLAGETRAALHASLSRLTDRQRELMTLLLEEPHLSYEEVGRRLALPIGSIGPTRARSLTRLRGERGLQALR
jgi:RNA polymerase sigma factor (sigma-70 family)